MFIHFIIFTMYCSSINYEIGRGIQLNDYEKGLIDSLSESKKFLREIVLFRSIA